MDRNGESTSKKKEADSSIVVLNNGKGESDESEALLPKGGLSKKKKVEAPRRKVQWNDTNGDKLAEVLEFQPSDASDSDDEDSETCFCNIMWSKLLKTLRSGTTSDESFSGSMLACTL